MMHPISDEQIATLSACIVRGNKIEAIKLYREMTGLGLKESKEAVEELEKTLPASAREHRSGAPKGKGCLGVLVVGLLCAGAFTYWIA